MNEIDQLMKEYLGESFDPDMLKTEALLNQRDKLNERRKKLSLVAKGLFYTALPFVQAKEWFRYLIFLNRFNKIIKRKANG